MTGALCLFMGVIAGLAMARTPTPAWMVVSAVSLVIACVPALRGHPGILRLAAVLAGALLVNVTVSAWRARVVMPASADTRVLLEARIRGTPARAGTEVRFDADVRVISGPVDARQRRARLAWRDATVVPRAGERWRLLVRLAAGEPRNFDGPDLARIALRDRIHLVGRVLPGNLDERLALAPASIDTMRARIAIRIRDAVSDPDAAALLTALAVGQTDAMSRDQWRVFNATGTTHLVAISGMHVTMFAVLAFGVARFAWRLAPFARHLDRETFASLAGITAAGAYALLAGFSVPAQRTWLMLSLFVAARLAARTAAPARTWALALVAVLLLDPLAPLSAGFWLSFIAVGVLIVVGQGALPSRAPCSLRARARAAVFLKVAVMALLAPLTVVVFGGISVAGLAVNLVAIPIISFLFVPLVLLGAVVSLAEPTLAAPCFRAAAALYEWLWPALVSAADSEVALWRVSPSAWWYAVAFPGVALALWRFPFALRMTALIVVLPLVCPPARLPLAGQARIDVLDAGRGASVLVTTRSRVWLFDTGDSWGSEGARARQVVLPALDALGRGVDELVLPARDPDRASGAALLAVERGVGTIRVGEPWPGSELPLRACRDSALVADGVRVELFAAGPRSGYCALRVSTGGHALLVGGDLDAAAERELVARLGARRLRSDAVILSRHASALASARQWIEASGAGIAIATGGIESRSRAEALERWRHAGARILDTRADGALALELRHDGLEIEGRASRSRYPFAWRRLP